MPYILWADDDVDDLMLIQETLETIDPTYKLIEARNGQEVIKYLDAIEDIDLLPNLVVLDMNMPIMSGRETLVMLKSQEKYSSIPVVLFTTSCSEVDRIFCMRYGIEMFTKPDNFKGYLNTCQKLLTLSAQPALEKLTG